MAGQLRLPPLMKRIHISSIYRRNIWLVFATVSFVSILTIWYVCNDQDLNTTMREIGEVRHVAFLKVHKTGSSSVQNIFIRFGDSRNLTFLLGSAKQNECDGFPNCISFNKTLHQGNIVPPPKGTSYEILCSHVIYNRDAFQKYLPGDTQYIGLVREPTKRLESAISFFKLFNGVSLTQFAQNATKYQHHMSNNRMAFEFGFKPEWFPSAAHQTLSEPELVEVNKYIDQLMNDFSLIMINERLDESLVLIRRLLGWSMKDIFYQRKMVRQHRGFQKEDIANVKKYLYLDYMLYERAMKSLVNKISEAGNNFTDEVKVYKTLNSEVNRYCQCTSCQTKPLHINSTQWYSAFLFTQEMCKNLNIGEIPYLHAMRVKQVGLNTALSELGDVNKEYLKNIGYGKS